MKTRKEYIQEVIERYHGRMLQAFYYDNEDIPYIEYFYDDNDKTLVAANVSVPFEYEIAEINCHRLDRSLCELEKKLIDYYKNELGIELLVPEA